MKQSDCVSCMKNCCVFERKNVREEKQRWRPQENQKKEERVGTRSDSLRRFQREKSLVLLRSFFYCCPLRARLLGLLHNAGPHRAAHHWLSCHFTLVSLWRTAAPEGLDTLVMKEVLWTHTRRHTHSESIRRCWAKRAKMGTQGEPPSMLLIEL